MGAITDIWHSERGLICVLILITATILCAIGRMTVDQWTTTVQWTFGTYVVGKTATGIMESVKNKPPSPPDPKQSPVTNNTNVVVESK